MYSIENRQQNANSLPYIQARKQTSLAKLQRKALANFPQLQLGIIEDIAGENKDAASIYASNFTLLQRDSLWFEQRVLDSVLWAIVPYTHYSDYSGDTCNKSNFQVWSRDYAKRPGVDWVEISYDYDGHEILVKLAALSTEDSQYAEAISGLLNYPILDEAHHSRLKQEIIFDDWGNDASHNRCTAFLIAIADQAIDNGVKLSEDNDDLFDDEKADAINEHFGALLAMRYGVKIPFFLGYAEDNETELTAFTGTPQQWESLLAHIGVYLDEHYSIETGCTAYCNIERLCSRITYTHLIDHLELNSTALARSIGQLALPFGDNAAIIPA